jgi:S-(hydroxymethyl)glutathione dehydrogenase/alcohol dehydrogenase
MTAVDDLQVEVVTMLEPSKTDVVVRIAASGVCHSDVAVFSGDSPMPPPVVLGHEAAGVVEWAGSGVTRVSVGQRVIASLSPVCGSCWHCRRGETHLCEHSMTQAFTPRVKRSDGTAVPCLSGLGTFAEAMTVNEWTLVPVETDVPFEQLALLGCGVTTGLGAVLNVANPDPGDSVCVIGCGGVGMAAVQAARIAGAGRVIAVDPVASKRDAAKQLGATDVIDPQAGDVVAQVKELTSGRGVDVAIEAAGTVAQINQATAVTRRGGTTVLVGAPRFDATATFSPLALLIEDKCVRGSYFGGTRALRDIPRYVDLIETGRLDLSSLVSQRVSLEEVGKVLTLPTGDAIRSVVI